MTFLEITILALLVFAATTIATTLVAEVMWRRQARGAINSAQEEQ
jgi:hypothetical protein